MSEKKTVQELRDLIEKQFGRGSIRVFGEETKLSKDSIISSGSIRLDEALGIGGYPKGRIVEIYGPEGSGKTTLALHAIAEAQKRNYLCMYIDTEHAFDVSYARNLGVNVNDLLFSQPDSGEQALSIAQAAISSGSCSVLVIDSVAALIPEAELRGEIGDVHVGLQARMMSQALRKMVGIINNSQCVIIFINQIRQKIGIAYGNPETTTGGNALKFYASIRLEVRKGNAIKEKEEFTGHEVKVKVVKNKTAPPFKTAYFEIMYGEGISKLGEIVDIGVEKNILEKSGAWYSYKNQKIGQGRENAKIFLKENSKIAEEIERAIGH